MLLEYFDSDLLVILHLIEASLHLVFAQRGPTELKFGHEFCSGPREMDNTETGHSENFGVWGEGGATSISSIRGR